MLSSVEQAFVGSDEKRAPLKTPVWEATSLGTSHYLCIGGVGGGGGNLFSSISCYFLIYDHPPQNKHTHTLTKQGNSSKNACQKGCFALDCQLVGNTIERLEMM